MMQYCRKANIIVSGCSWNLFGLRQKESPGSYLAILFVADTWYNTLFQLLVQWINTTFIFHMSGIAQNACTCISVKSNDPVRLNTWLFYMWDKWHSYILYLYHIALLSSLSHWVARIQFLEDENIILRNHQSHHLYATGGHLAWGFQEAFILMEHQYNHTECNIISIFIGMIYHFRTPLSTCGIYKCYLVHRGSRHSTNSRL